MYRIAKYIAFLRGVAWRAKKKNLAVYSNFGSKQNGIEGKTKFGHPRALWTFYSSVTFR
jgi:hypothetical protein